MRFRAPVASSSRRSWSRCGGGAAQAHPRCLQRGGASRENATGRLYSGLEDEADGAEFLDRGREDRHQFHLIVAPEDSVDLGDLEGFTRQLMGRDLEFGPQSEWEVQRRQQAELDLQVRAFTLTLPDVEMRSLCPALVDPLKQIAKLGSHRSKCSAFFPSTEQQVIQSRSSSAPVFGIRQEQGDHSHDLGIGCERNF
jgi:hypothetical protein